MDLSPDTWKKIKDIVKCPICNDMLNDAKFLPCGHTFCQSCLEECHRHQPSTTGITCPFCSFHHMRAGLSDLPKNLIAEDVAEVVRNLTGNVNAENGQLLTGTAEGRTKPRWLMLWETFRSIGFVLFILVLVYGAKTMPLKEFIPEPKQLEILSKASSVCEYFLSKRYSTEKQECGFTSRPQNPKKGDSLVLSCSVIVNGLRNASLIFRNDYDESEITGIMSECDSQPSIDTKICSTVEVTADADILAYSCRLKFPPSKWHYTKASQFHSSKWTAEFNEEIICTLPKIYLEAIPSDVSFLCNHMPCGDTASVNDTVTCLGHGYPQPVFDLRIQKLSSRPTNTPESQGVEVDPIFMDTADESSEVEIKGFEDYRIRQKDVGQVKLTCNVSNELGWGCSSLVLEILGGKRYSTEKQECGFTSRPQNPKKGDSLVLSCSVIVNGLRNASLIFRNDYDESEITGIMSECDSQPSIGTKICSPVEVTADADILAYSCRLKFPPSEGHDVKASQFHSSTWTAEFNEEIICTLPKIYLEDVLSGSESYTTEDYGISKDYLTTSEAPSVLIQCNGFRCEENHTLVVGDEISCIGGGGMSFDKFVLVVNKQTIEGDDKEVKYVLQMADIGDINVECLAYLTSGVTLVRNVPVIVRESKPEQGEAAGDIDLDEAATLIKKPSGKPDSGSAAGEKEVPKVNDEMDAEKSGTAGDDNPKPSIGSGRESFVLLQLFLAFIAAFVGLGQF